MNGLISVIFPVWNAEKYVGKTMENVLGQTYRNLQVICVLDGPTDDSEKIVRKYAAADARVKVIKLDNNIGPGPARNHALRFATGGFIHFMDSDDFLSHDFYERMVAAAEAGGADAACSEVLYEHNPKTSIWFRRAETVFEKDKFSKPRVLLHGWAWRYLIRRKFWDKNGFEFPPLMLMEDMPVMVSMVYHADKITLVPGAVYFYKDRPTSFANTKLTNPVLKNRKKTDFRKAKLMVRDFCRTHGIRMPGRLGRLHVKIKGLFL